MLFLKNALVIFFKFFPFKAFLKKSIYLIKKEAFSCGNTSTYMESDFQDV